MGIKEKLDRLYQESYNRVRRYSAQKTRIKQFKGKSSPHALSDEQKEQIREFYKPYKSPSLVFHSFFTEKTGEFHVNYVPQDLYVGYIDPYMNDLNAAKYFENKCYFDVIFHGIPQPYNILKRMNGIWFDIYGNPVDRVRMEKLLSKEQQGVFVKKAEGSSGGHGVTYIHKSDKMLTDINIIINNIDTDILIQRELFQHPRMAAFNPSSVNSLRLYSILGLDGKVTIYSAVMRIGVGETKVDNYSSGGISCGIDNLGRLRKYGYYKSGERTESHPLSGIIFENYEIPNYYKAVELVKKSHLMVPHFRSVSWDIAITEIGEVLIEANLCRGGIDLLQLSNGPLFGEDTRKILDEVFIK